jgi:glycosyltransferase involved in cell wall biosynthesis
VDARVDFRGRLPSMDDVHREIAAADALIHPAWHEAFGQVCLEALAMGVPVICLDWCGPGRIVTPACGIKVAPGTRQQIIEGFARAIPGLRGHAFGDAANARARDSFSWDVIARRIEAAWPRAAGA